MLRLVLVLGAIIGWVNGAARQAASVVVDVIPHAAGACSGMFVAHDLPHITRTSRLPVRQYESNGAGLALQDLNEDGRLDIILAGLAAPSVILWNEGGGQFRAQELDTPPGTRGVTAIDVDADGLIDLAFTHQRGAPFVRRSRGDGRFTFGSLPGIRAAAYALDWADIDGDGDLDAATGSYDAELNQLFGSGFLSSGGAGVFAYRNDEGLFVPTRLASEAQALVVLLADIDGDGAVDLAIGNDFALPDAFWRYTDDGWFAWQPFQTITHSTMSFDLADIDNSGRMAFFAADMQPVSTAPEIVAQWQPVLGQIERFKPPNDPQIIENVLQMPDAAGFVNRAQEYGLTATGWSWSAKFGDLDQDGWQDLYVVNGMLAADLLAHIDGGEIREANVAFRNDEGKGFVAADAWGLGGLESGRGMSMGDLDGDGDLDIVINNLNAPSQWFENQMCGGAALTLDARQPGANWQAIGTRVTLRTSTGDYTRMVRASSGYLSGDPTRLHFGFPNDSTLHELIITWRDGTQTRIREPQTNSRLVVTRLL